MQKIFSALAGTLFALAVAAGENPEETMTDEMIPFAPTFPLGAPNTAYARYFTGKSWVATLTKNAELGVPLANVTFEPGCRNSWHSHTGGQILVATDGVGYYQEKGAPARRLVPGDVVEIAPNVVHWHGAAPSSWFSHLAISCNPRTNANTWLEPVSAAEYRAATLASEAAAASAVPAAGTPELAATDPELAAILDRFTRADVFENSAALSPHERALVTLACCVARGGVGEYSARLDSALASGAVSPVEAREALYQAVPYVGFAAVADFVPAANAVFRARGVALPLPPQSTTSPETRFEKGLATQVSIFGERITKMRAAAPANQRHFQDFLSANCFGDHVARGGLDVRTRELITFATLISLGGCDPQVKGHVAGNLALGNDKEKLLAVVTQLVPFNGYPRTLNALAALNEAAPEQ
ncbi:MAG: cupin domain-containing carboxymuconolactone decarboxylase family protein [Candidatus Spyradosoma sp.]